MRTLRVVGRRTRGYRLHISRGTPGLAVARRGRYTSVQLGPVRLEWYPA
jgi:hypothetical protein